MNLKKTLFTSMAAITLLSVGTTAIAANRNAEVVEAKTVSRKLKRNAAIYTSHGKRTHKKHLKKGKKIKIYGYKTIKGKKYARIGKNKYILVSNLASAKKKAVKKTNQSTSNNSSDTTDDDITPVDPAKLAVYKGWLKNRKNGNLVALRETKAEYDGSDDDDAPEIIRKGQAIKIPDDDDNWGTDIINTKTGFNLEISGTIGGYVYNLADFDFKTYDGSYKSKLKNIEKYTNDDGDAAKISFVPTASVVSLPAEEGTQTLTAGKRVTLYNPDLLINGDSEYVVEANNSKGYTFQVPYNQITGWKRP
ncbi:SLAP domain-containing protein [Lactobacillus ultunensis]|uniref:SLAP domain-containing protein n=1 Tax=Lactobacillus ultunensis TaxID=227945 RepID=UPI001912F2F9|nr:SLAP domain-containing protein [Lactobacillus ultunensis]QQP29216.1 SLAP domain-containing protein [Lactobacillus ultunensis]